jgi:hypothetical protein
MARIGGPSDVLSERQIADFVRDQLAILPLEGRSVCVLVPDYLDPQSIDIEAWSADPGTLVVPDAGEYMYRLS